MDISMLATSVNCVLQDVKDRQFIMSLKKQLDNIPQEDKDDNLNEIILWLSDLIKNNVTEKIEATFYLSSRDITDNLRGYLTDDSDFSKSFKRDLLTKLSTSSSISTLKPRIESLLGQMDRISYTSGKRAIDGLYDLYKSVDELQKVAYKTKIQSSSGNIVIIDPIDKTTHGTMGPVLEELQQAVSNKIKTIKVIDEFVGGGFAPKTFNLFAAIGGNGKSLTLQNILLYASKNNDRTLFDLEAGLKPCLVFVSLELSKKQCSQRQLAWCGEKVTDEELLHMSEEELDRMVIEHGEKLGFNLPIIYIERIQGQYTTTVDEIDSECDSLVNAGFQPVMIAIDYLDRLDVASSKHKTLSVTGGEGSALLRQKGAECRELAFRRNCPVISAAQLNGEAQGELNKVEPYLRQIDIVHHFGTNMLAGSKQLQTELDTIIFQHKIEVENKTQEAEIIETTEFIAMSVMKDRDGHSSYKVSRRDRENEIEYRKYTQKLRNSPMADYLKDTTRLHAVIPLHGFKLDEIDYGRSIRMFYTSEKAEFVNLEDLIPGLRDRDVDDYDKGIVEPNELDVNIDAIERAARMKTLEGL